MMRRTTGSGVTARKWCGLDERSISHSTPLALNRATHLRKARGLIPPSHEAAPGSARLAQIVPIALDPAVSVWHSYGR